MNPNLDYLKEAKLHLHLCGAPVVVARHPTNWRPARLPLEPSVRDVREQEPAKTGAAFRMASASYDNCAKKRTGLGRVRPRGRDGSSRRGPEGAMAHPRNPNHLRNLRSRQIQGVRVGAGGIGVADCWPCGLRAACLGAPHCYQAYVRRAFLEGRFFRSARRQLAVAEASAVAVACLCQLTQGSVKANLHQHGVTSSACFSALRTSAQFAAEGSLVAFPS